jgi:hypothetical protein
MVYRLLIGFLATFCLLAQSSAPPSKPISPPPETPPQLTTDALMIYWRAEAKAQKAAGEMLKAQQEKDRADAFRDAQLDTLRHQCGTYKLAIQGTDTLVCVKQ